MHKASTRNKSYAGILYDDDDNDGDGDDGDDDDDNDDDEGPLWRF